jgi:thiamine-monophosphate kinase
MDMDFLGKLFAGMRSLAREYDLPLLGGDLSKADKLSLCVNILGETDHVLRRAQAKSNDLIFLIGQTGLARAGLILLERAGRAACADYPYATAAHLMPRPLIEQGILLRKFAKKHPKARISLMDVSDGLARDLPRLIGLRPSGSAVQHPRGLGAIIALPTLHPEISRFTAQQGINAIEHCFAGGEDYALAGTCDPYHFERLRELLPDIVRIGEVTPDAGIRLEGAKQVNGFDHFGQIM